LVVEGERGRLPIGRRDLLHKRALADLPRPEHDHDARVVKCLEHEWAKVTLDHDEMGRQICTHTLADLQCAPRQIFSRGPS